MELHCRTQLNRQEQHGCRCQLVLRQLEKTLQLHSGTDKSDTDSQWQRTERGCGTALFMQCRGERRRKYPLRERQTHVAGRLLGTRRHPRPEERTGGDHLLHDLIQLSSTWHHTHQPLRHHGLRGLDERSDGQGTGDRRR